MHAHLYQVGQTVVLTGQNRAASAPQKTFRIVATMPESNNLLQYRIRCDAENHERVAAEDSLETISPADAGIWK